MMTECLCKACECAGGLGWPDAVVGIALFAFLGVAIYSLNKYG